MKCMRFVLVVCLVGLPLSCIGFRGNQLGAINGWPPIIEEKKSISYVVSGKVEINGKPTDVQPATMKAWKKHLDEVYRDSGLFSSVKEGFSETDIRAEVEITDVGQGNFALAFLSGLTLCVIPAYASDTITIQTTFKDNKGNILGKVAKQEEVYAWFQILLLPVTPFKSPGSVGEKALCDINRAVLLEAQKKGIF